MKRSNGNHRHNQAAKNAKHRNALNRMRARQHRSHNEQLQLCATRVGESKREVTRLLSGPAEYSVAGILLS